MLIAAMNAAALAAVDLGEQALQIDPAQAGRISDTCRRIALEVENHG
jgi:hypothetical protein